MFQYIQLNTSFILTVSICVCIFLLIYIVLLKNKKNKTIIKNTPNMHNLLSITDDSYKVYQIDNLLESSECDALCSYADTQNYMGSTVITPTGNVYIDTRKSKQLWIKDSDHDVAKKISSYIENHIGYPKENMEDLQLVKYDISGFFNDHYDPDISYKNNTSDRIYTVIIYLNDDFEGGETYFKNINLTIKPKKGMGVIFKSLSENNELLSNSLHTGKPIIKGNKYICNKWIHIDKLKE
jgi:prolyl 4-hydroxylase